jgi:membrane dipeptidase
MSRLFALLAACLTLVSLAARSDAEPQPAVNGPVIDLRVGLQENVTRRGRNLWEGTHQAGISQLRRGRVAGVLATYGASSTEATTTGLATGFTQFKSALLSSQAFEPKGCSARPGRISTWFELDAPDSLGADPSQVGLWATRGVSVFRLVGRRDNALASSAVPSGPVRAVGLTQAGRQVVENVLQAGALVDVSFLSDIGLTEVLELAGARQAPVIATQTSARAVLNRPGSFDDSQLMAIARTGGVVALSLDRSLIGDGINTSLDDVVRQLEHLVRVAGPEHVAIASGFETGSVPPSSLGNATRFPRLAQALAARGMNAIAVRSVLYDNAFRVLCKRV